MKKTLKLYFIFVTFTNSIVFSDKIIAKVDNEIILASDVYEAQQRLSSDGYAPLFDIITLIINQKILLSASDKSTISSTEIDNEVDANINMFVSRLGSIKKVEKYFHSNIYEIKNNLKQKLEEQFFIESAKKKIIGNITVTLDDISNFYLSGNSSLLSSMCIIDELILGKKIGDSLKNSISQAINSYVDLILSGHDFFDLGSHFDHLLIRNDLFVQFGESEFSFEDLSKNNLSKKLESAVVLGAINKPIKYISDDESFIIYIKNRDERSVSFNFISIKYIDDVTDADIDMIQSKLKELYNNDSTFEKTIDRVLKFFDDQSPLSETCFYVKHFTRRKLETNKFPLVIYMKICDKEICENDFIFYRDNMSSKEDTIAVGILKKLIPSQEARLDTSLAQLKSIATSMKREFILAKKIAELKKNFNIWIDDSFIST